MIFLPRVRGVSSAMQMQNHVVRACPLRHRLDGGVADDEIDHHDAAAELVREVGALVHVFHRGGRDVEVVALHLAGVRALALFTASIV